MSCTSSATGMPIFSSPLIAWTNIQKAVTEADLAFSLNVGVEDPWGESGSMVGVVMVVERQEKLNFIFLCYRQNRQRLIQSRS